MQLCNGFIDINDRKHPKIDLFFIFSTGKPPAGPIQQLKGKVGPSQGGSTYTMQRQSSRVSEN